MAAVDSIPWRRVSRLGADFAHHAQDRPRPADLDQILAEVRGTVVAVPAGEIFQAIGQIRPTADFSDGPLYDDGRCFNGINDSMFAQPE